MLTNPKPLGWAYGEILTSAQMNTIASQLPFAIDGAGGGTYALGATALTITGTAISSSQPTCRSSHSAVVALGQSQPTPSP